ncbi:MAG TPA: hypothetical protein VFQ88_05150 [Nevskiaceae bacterium]|nr:hypothetical protein [Nevskiaceae bacterium]
MAEPKGDKRPYRRTWGAACFAAALMLGAAGSARAAAAACQPALAAHAWQPLLALAGQPGDGAASANFLSQTLAIQQRVLMHTQLSPQVANLKDEVYNSLRDFDLAELYGFLPDHPTPPWHSVTISGVPTASTYQVSTVASSAINTAPVPYGALIYRFDMQPVSHNGGPGGDRYQLKARARLDTGVLRWPSVLTAMRVGLENLSKPAPIGVSPDDIKAVEATSPDLSDYDARIIAQFAQAFPATFQWFSKIGHVADLSLTDEGTTSGPYHLYVAFQLDDKGLRKLYPEVENYLQRLGDFMSGTFDVTNGDGRWMNVHFDTARRRLTMDMWVDHGRPVPSHNGQPARSFIDAKVPSQLQWQTFANLRFTALGVSVALNNWPADWRYDASGGALKLTGFTHVQPQVTVSGKALGVFPASWMESLMPVNIADAVNGFMEVLTHGNGGKGAELTASLDAPATGDSVADAGVDATLLDNFFVRLGMAMVSHRVLPDSDQVAGLKKIANDGLTAYGEDLARMAQLTGGNSNVPVPAACAAQ